MRTFVLLAAFGLLLAAVTIEAQDSQKSKVKARKKPNQLKKGPKSGSPQSNAGIAEQSGVGQIQNGPQNEGNGLEQSDGPGQGGEPSQDGGQSGRGPSRGGGRGSGQNDGPGQGGEPGRGGGRGGGRVGGQSGGSGRGDRPIQGGGRGSGQNDGPGQGGEPGQDGGRGSGPSKNGGKRRGGRPGQDGGQGNEPQDPNMTGNEDQNVDSGLSQRQGLQENSEDPQETINLKSSGRSGTKNQNNKRIGKSGNKGPAGG